VKTIVAINASPRTGWNTETLVRAAAKGAEAEGAQTEIFDLYRKQPFTGCVSCFGCKRPANLGECVYKDGLTPILSAIRQADGLILGTPNYLGDISAGCRALYERLIFQSLTYKTEPKSYNRRQIPVLLIMTSNVPEELYPHVGYDRMLESYRSTLNKMVGPTKIMVCGDTLQVHDYEKYGWTMFDQAAKQARRAQVFPGEQERAFALGREMAAAPWKAE